MPRVNRSVVRYQANRLNEIAVPFPVMARPRAGQDGERRAAKFK